jgi:two-component system NtrC family sensor kinase
MENNEYLIVDGFDREYEIQDLLPCSLAAELLNEISSSVTAAIVKPDGSAYYGGISFGKDQFAGLCSKENNGCLTASVSRRALTAFPIIHELETIGLLVLLHTDDSTSSREQLRTFGSFAIRAVQQVITLMYRYKMTAGLHGQVVEESYLRLKEKAAALKRSEEKYRLLAENLEIEVENKTREIKEAQLLMLQQEKMASIGQLAAGMAHEINNPIGFVISNLSTLKSSTKDMAALIDLYDQLAKQIEAQTVHGNGETPTKKKLLKIETLRKQTDIEFIMEDTVDLISESLEGAKRVKDIVQNLRNFTHPGIETVETTNINDCLEATLAVLSNLYAPDIEIDRQFGQIPNITCNIREINLVFFNILKNAFQAVKKSGRITIRTDHDGDSVRVSFTDTGEGIEKEHLGRIFDPFFTTRQVGDGAGLGLTQAYNAVQSYGGVIKVESAKGAGSTFIVNMPINYEKYMISTGRLVNF